MIEVIEKVSKYILVVIFVFLFAFPLSEALSDDNGNNGDVEELPLAPSDPDISDVCTLSDCSPAKPCPDSDQSCYTLNGVFYCCTSAPDPGMEAVGD